MAGVIQKHQAYIHVSSRIRTHDPNIRAVQDYMRLRQLGEWDRHYVLYGVQNRVG